jgi:phospholipid/cholesterol/gamma-HCH transport system substrate-binding protein
MSESIKNIAIGIVISLALCAVAIILLFLHPSFGDGGQKLHVRFVNIEKIYTGSRVSYAGNAIGKVVSIVQLPEDARVEKGGNLYVYELTLAIDSKAKVYDTDEITVSTAGLMGERFISIIPNKPSKNTKSSLLNENSLVYASQPLGTEAMFEKVYEVSTEAEKMFRALADVVETTSPQIKETFRNASVTSSDLKNVVATISAAESTFGKMAMNDDLYVKTSAVLSKLDLVLRDINTYGFLFHLDKSWLRERKRQIEEIEAIKDTKDLQRYLQNELSKIHASAARIEQASKKAKQLGTSEEYYEACGEITDRLSSISQSLENKNFDTKKIIVEEQ